VQVGVVELKGRGAHLARRFLATGHECAVYDRSPRLVAELGAAKAYGASSLADLIHELDAPRIVWLTGSAAEADAAIEDLRKLVEAGDVLVDASESESADAVRRARLLARIQVQYVDVGICGGMPAHDEGSCLTVGGDEQTVKMLSSLFEDLTLPLYEDRHPVRRRRSGFLGRRRRRVVHCGPVGAGHFVRSVHDAIERRLIAAYAEGFALLHNGQQGPAGCEYAFDLLHIAETWRSGSPIASTVLDRAEEILSSEPEQAAASRPRQRPWDAEFAERLTSRLNDEVTDR
jgi:6-phosphogluconate dehydrogenase